MTSQWWQWNVVLKGFSVFEVSHRKHNWLHSVCEDSGLCAADCTVHKYTICTKCRHTECSVHIFTTVMRTATAYRFQPLCHSSSPRIPRQVPRGPTPGILQPNICSPLHKQLLHRQMSVPRRIMQRSVLPRFHSIHIRSPVQQQTAHIQVSITGRIMQSSRLQ